MSATTTGAIGTDGDRRTAGERLKSLPAAVWRGRATDAVWVRPVYLGLLAMTAILTVWDLGASGWANSFYTAAVQAGSTNWEAFLYGSSDAGNSITVDKPPAALWVMALSVRIFGLNPWALLLPQAIMGVLTVALVVAIVRRRFSAPAALIAGGVTALTPVAILMFRFNNPDALLVLLLTIAVYFTLRGIEDGRVRWIMLAGAAVGLGFLTKQLQAFLVLPALGLVYLSAAPKRFPVRVLHALAGIGTLIVSAGWWVAIVELVPANMRPYVGGSTDDSFLNLTFGYNGISRLTGNGNGGGGGGGFGGATGITRLFQAEFGTQISWLMPAALAVFVLGIVVLWRRPRIDGQRALVLLFGGVMIVSGLAFSFGQGTIHQYYSIALAPSIGGLIGIGAQLIWQRRLSWWAAIVGAVLVLGSTIWSVVLLAEASDFLPWLRAVVVITGVLGAGGILFARYRRELVPVAIGGSLVAALAGPAAFSVETMLTPHSGSTPTAGPAVASSGFGGGRAFGQGGGTGGFAQGQGFRSRFGGGTGTGARAGAAGDGGFGQPPAGAGGTGAAAGTGTRGGFGGGAGATRGGFGGGGTASSAVTALLTANASNYRWVAATTGSDSAATYQLAARASVMPIGGFTGSDPSPTLAQFKAWVAAGDIHYFIASGQGGGFGGRGGTNSSSSAITSWVESNFTAQSVGGTTMYDLTAPASSSSTGA